MKKKRLYDTKCFELAKAFLSDEPEFNLPEYHDELAADIQQAIEDGIESFQMRQGAKP